MDGGIIPFVKFAHVVFHDVRQADQMGEVVIDNIDSAKLFQEIENRVEQDYWLQSQNVN